MRYLSLVADVGVDQVTQVVQQAVPDAKDLAMTIAEQLQQRGMQLARLADLRRVLELRFGALDPGLAARLEAVEGEDLQRLFDRAVIAPSIEEFLGDDRVSTAGTADLGELGSHDR